MHISQYVNFATDFMADTYLAGQFLALPRLLTIVVLG